MNHYTAALIGGPEAGKLYAVTDRIPLTVARLPERFFLSAHEADDLEPITPETVVYEPRAMEFFGARFFVWCAPEFMGDGKRNEFAAQLGAHILSPLGLSLLKEGAQ